MGATGRGSEPVVVVNEAFARLFWPGQRSDWPAAQMGFVDVRQPVAHRGGPCRRHTLSRTDQREAEHLRRLTNTAFPSVPATWRFAARSPASVAAAIRRAVAEPGTWRHRCRASSHCRICSPRRSRVRGSRPRSSACFAALALLLSVVGTYGTLSFFVRQRRREIGIRMALGAAPSNVRSHRAAARSDDGRARRSCSAGASALAIGRLVQPILFGVSAADPLVLAGTAASMLISVLAATVLPTRLATRTDPLLVLRGD